MKQHKQDDGIRIHADSAVGEWETRVQTPVRLEYDNQSYADDDLARRLSSPVSPRARGDEGSVRDDEEDGRQRRRSKYVETLAQPDRAYEDGINRPRKGGFLNKTKEIFRGSEPPPMVSNRLPSIEAWLEEQPDPFVDQHVAFETTTQIKEPRSETRTSRKDSSREASIMGNPNKIWESIAPPTQPIVLDDQNARSSTYVLGAEDDATPLGTKNASTNVTEHEPWRETRDDSPGALRRRNAKSSRRHGVASPREAVVQATEQVAPSDEEDIPPPTPLKSQSLRRQNRRQRPCPPTGPHHLATIASVETFREAIPEYSEPVADNGSGLKRKLTTHEDLLSVLSMPRAGKSLRSARSVRHLRTQQDSSSVQEALQELAAEEAKYRRELQTLVDGVIPVLLQCVLSKTGSVAAAGLFTSSAGAHDDLNFAQPIIGMGVALERLKSLHKRIPLDDIDNLLSWAQTAHKAYSEYLKAWRLGFQGVVVNLALMNETTNDEDHVMARDDSGDVVDAQGKKADVAYLLKRPLVRIKNLGKTFKCIEDGCNNSAAKDVVQGYSELTAMAKRRHQEEQARLEDEAAANIDSTKARQIRTLAAITNVQINKSRKVKARDCFDLTMYHSTGQRLDCRIEIILREDQTEAGGDVLICEMDDEGKWLLFPPVETGLISARKGETGCDLVIMVRGRAGIGREWHELLALKTSNPDAATEWMGMLGSNPLPPRLTRTPSFVNRRTETITTMPHLLGKTVSEELPELPNEETVPVSVEAAEIQIPFGEPSLLGARDNRKESPRMKKSLLDKPLPRLNLGGGLQSKLAPQYLPHGNGQLQRKPVGSATSVSIHSSNNSIVSDQSSMISAERTYSDLAPSSRAHSSSVQLRRRQVSQPEKTGREDACEAESPRSRAPPTSWTSENGLAAHGPSPIDHAGKERVASPQYKQSAAIPAVPESVVEHVTSKAETKPVRPTYSRAISSTPSKELPTVNKIRNPRAPSSECSTPLSDSMHDRWSAMPGHSGRKDTTKHPTFLDQIYSDVPRPLALSNQSAPTLPTSSEDQPPPPPTHRTLSNDSTKRDVSVLPNLQPVSPPTKQGKRRSSSPLKHEYAPSTASESSSDSDSEYTSESCSDTSDELHDEDGDKVTPLVAVTGGERRKSFQHQQPPASIPPSTGTRTLAPSDSASQGPYRKVPSSTHVPSSRKSRTIATVCAWSDKDMWKPINDDECSIVISPGLIEAYEMSADHSMPKSASNDGDESRTSSFAQRPLVAFELTPIVPLRRGTAVDISIRSPPTPNSKIRTTNNIMFRSRNPEECEALYAMINWARCNNPTYISLQNARPQQQPSLTFNTGAPHTRTKSGSWFSWSGSQKKSSYRASSAPAPVSIGDDSIASAGTMTGAISALKRFSSGSPFSLNRSSVVRKMGHSAEGSLYSSSSGTKHSGGTGSGTSTPAPSQAGFIPGKDGPGPNVPPTSAAAAHGGGMVNNMKIRLYIRKGQNWENLGAGRLSILPAPIINQDGSITPTRPKTDSPPASHSPSISGHMVVGAPNTSRGPRLPSSQHTPHRIHGNGREKRILVVHNKDHERVLLDKILGESCFERVARQGIAVKVWDEKETIGETGGVVTGREKVYCLQFNGTKEAGWVFGLCGSYRYGETPR